MVRTLVREIKSTGFSLTQQTIGELGSNGCICRYSRRKTTVS